MATLWTINDTPLADLGIEEIVATYRNRAPDSLRFTMPGAVEDAPFFAVFAPVVLAKAGVPWFRGLITSAPRQEVAMGGEHLFEAQSALYWLDHIVYEQAWRVADDPDLAAPDLVSVLSPHAILGLDPNGAAMSAGAQIADILSFAAAAGAGFQVAPIDIPTVLPWDEMRNRTCSEALDSVLRMIGDAVLWVDHSTDPVTVRVARRGALDNVVYSPGDSKVERLSINDRDDLARPAVVLRYHRTHRLNQYAWEQVVTDHYPAELPEDWRLRGLVSGVELAGAVTSASWLEQPVGTRAIPSGLVFGGSPGDYVTAGPVLDFWKRKIPALAAANVSEVTLRNGTHAFETALPRELSEGAITDWMIDRMGVQAEEQTATVEAMYKIDGQWVVTPGDEPPIFSAPIVATNAATRVYSSLEDLDYQPPEPVPEGLAEQLYQTLQGPWQEISLGLVERECGGTVRPGRNLNGQPVQEVVETIHTGETSVEAGPPEHLGAADLVEQLRARRDRVLTDAWRRRTTGSALT